MNKNLLLEIFRIPSQSARERDIQQFIIKFLGENDVKHELDDIGNVFNIDQPDKPLLCAHMDTVQDDDDVQLAGLINLRKGILSGYGVIGGDDKCGIYIILNLIAQGFRDFNFLFCVEEEIGCVGSINFVQKKDISSFPYGIVLDRRNKGDIICAANGYGTKKFQSAISKIGKEFGYTPCAGAVSDADKLRTQISCANLSVGYYNPHLKNEYVIVSQLVNAENFTKAILDNVTENFQAPPERSYGAGFTPGARGRQYREYFDEDYYYNDHHKGGFPYKNLGKFEKRDATASGKLLTAPGATGVIEKTEKTSKDGLTKPSETEYNGICRGCDLDSLGLYHLAVFDDGFGEFYLCEECIISIADKLDEILISLGYKSAEI